MIRFQGHLGNQTVEETGWFYGEGVAGGRRHELLGLQWAGRALPQCLPGGLGAAWPSDISSSPAVLPGPFSTHPSNPSAITRRRQTLCFLYRGHIRMW